MSGFGSAFDRNRHAQPAAFVLCAILGALVLWQLVRLVWAVVPRDDAALDTPPVRVPASAAAGVGSQSIARWHLFGETPALPGSGPGAPATTLSLILRGTFAGSDPGNGIAVIADSGNGERAFRAGDDVLPGVRLKAVHPDHVVLGHDGVEETLALTRDSNLAPADVLRPTPAKVRSRTPAAAIDAGARPGATETASAGVDIKAPPDWQQTVEHLRRNPAELMQRVQVVPVMDGNRISGMRLAATSDTALIRQIGLQPGDIVTAVDGRAVDSLASGQQIMASLGNAGSVRVTVLRGGQQTEISVGLK